MNQFIIAGQFLMIVSATLYHYSKSNTEQSNDLETYFNGMIFGLMLYSYGAQQYVNQPKKLIKIIS